MKPRGIFCSMLSSIVVASVFFAAAGISYATDIVTVYTTSSGVNASNTAGGGFSLEWATDAYLGVGNKIYIDLDYRSASERVTLCRDIDLEISFGGSGGQWTDAVTPEGQDGNNTASPFYDPTLVANPEHNGVYFRISGTMGSSRITVEIMGDPGDFITVGSSRDDSLVLEFLNGMTNMEYDRDGVWIEGSTADVYDVAATVLDNTLCLDLSNWNEATVSAHIFTEGPSGFTFIPSVVEIAHIVP